MLSKYAIAITAGGGIVTTAIGDIATIVGGATGIVHTDTTAPLRESILVDMDTGSVITIIIITTIELERQLAAAVGLLPVSAICKNQEWDT